MADKVFLSKRNRTFFSNGKSNELFLIWSIPLTVITFTFVQQFM